jgi:hypothetical protein
MRINTTNHCINELYLMCDNNKNCLKCISEENKSNEKWINQEFIVRLYKPAKKIKTN